MGWAWSKDGIFAPAPHDFVLPHSRPTLYDMKKFLAPSPPIGASWSPAPPRKTLLFINFPHKYYNFLIKHVSLIKIYLKLQLNLSYQIKLFFSKNYIILFECIFNKIISQQQQQQKKKKKKIQSITNNKIEAKSHVG